MEVRNSNFACFMDSFTANTYVMVVCSDTTIRKCQIGSAMLFLREPVDWSIDWLSRTRYTFCTVVYSFFGLGCDFFHFSSSFTASAAMLINIRNARKHFEKLERLDQPRGASAVSSIIRWRNDAQMSDFLSFPFFFFFSSSFLIAFNCYKSKTDSKSSTSRVWFSSFFTVQLSHRRHKLLSSKKYNALKAVDAEKRKISNRMEKGHHVRER